MPNGMATDDLADGSQLVAATEGKLSDTCGG